MEHKNQKQPPAKRPGQAPKSEVAASMQKRMLVAALAFSAFALLLLVPNLVKIQIRDYEDYKVKAENLQLRDTAISAARGTIYDANMKPLAVSATVWTVYVSPKEVKEKDREAIATGLADILEVDRETILEKLQKTNSYYEVIKLKVEKPQADAVREFCSEGSYSGVDLVQDAKRYYPYGAFAADILGFVGTDNQGLAGLEAYYDDLLSGTAGRVVSAKNAWGYDMPYEYEAMYEAQDGYSLVLTVDEVIQHYLEKYLGNAVEEHNVQAKGVGIVMDVNTGAILAMSTQPSYDPNTPFTIYDQDAAALLEGLTGDAYTTQLNLARQQQWRNKAVSDLYEPGSVFKIITAAAALDAGVTTTGTSYTCRGSINVAGTTMRCAHTEGHGTLTMAQSLINSCNPNFIQISAQLGKESFSSYIEAFGLGKKTGVDLPGEAQGILVPESKMGPVELASCSFGQSNKVTPLEMITAVCAAVNGGYLVQPHMVSQVLDADGNVVSSTDTTPVRQVISSEVSSTIASILEEAVLPGNPCNRAYVLGYRVGGKSGTSQKLDSGDADLRIASFVGIAPAENPQIAVLIILDEPDSPTNSSYGGVLAGPVVGSVMAETLPYIGVTPVYSESDQANMEKSVPNTVGSAVSDAQVALQKRGFTYSIKGNGSTVLSQSPAYGSMTVGSTVILYTEENIGNTVQVPNFVGKSYQVAKQMAAAAGLNIKVSSGSATGSSLQVISQSAKAGSEVTAGSVITLDCLDTTITD